MTKSTKIIAALGVVAGFGVAALPLASYAADPSDTATVNVTVTSTDSITVPDPANINIALGSALTGESTSANIVVNWHQTGKYKITYAGNDLTASGTDVKIAASTSATLGDEQYAIKFGEGSYQQANTGDAVTAQTGKGSNLTHAVQYKAQIKDSTPATTYTGTVTYTLLADAS